MLILECVEPKKECKGSKWGELLSIFSLVLRHSSGVATRGTVACKAGAPACTIEYLRACLGRPVAICLLGCFVATENFLS